MAPLVVAARELCGRAGAVGRADALGRVVVAARAGCRHVNFVARGGCMTASPSPCAGFVTASS